MNVNHNLHVNNRLQSFLIKSYTVSVYLAVIGIVYFALRFSADILTTPTLLRESVLVILATILVSLFYRFEPKKYRK